MDRQPLVARWVLGDRAQNPPGRSLLPMWNLSVVLSALTKKLFEPLRQAAPRDSTLKVLFLLTATSAYRVSEIYTESIPPFLSRTQYFRLALNAVFLPKTSTGVALSSDLEITAFYPDPINALEWGFHLMCPVRALRISLRHTEHFRGPNRSRFIHWDEGSVHCPVSKRWISSYRAIRSAYRHQGREHEIVRANPHLIRSVATSWAEIARVPSSEICRVVTWSGPCTFAQFYQLDFSGGGFGVDVLETAAQAGSA